jgi:DNA-binding IclR family transcriptional regulator
MSQGTKNYSVPALEKSIMILNALSEGDLTISEIHLKLKLPKTTTFVILNTLEQFDIIRKTSENKYRLGTGVLRWSIRYFESLDLVQIARPHLERLVYETPYTSHLAVLMDNKPVYCDKVEGNGFVRFASSIGQSQPLHQSSVGKALAAGMSEKEIRSVLQNALDDPTAAKSTRMIEKFLDDVRFVQKHGFSIEDEEFEEGVRCIGAPIRDYTNKIIASMSITALSINLPAVEFLLIGEKIKNIADLISRELGYNGLDQKVL